MDLNERLAAARKAAGFKSAADAAGALGVPYPTYAGHENGSSGFKRESAIKYARKFKVKLEWLEAGKGPMADDAADDVEQKEALELLRQAKALGKISEAASYLRFLVSSAAKTQEPPADHSPSEGGSPPEPK